MAGNHNSGRKPKYLTVEKFEEFKNKLFNNDLFHMKVELRVQSIITGVTLALVVTLLVAFYVG